ncbi:hypothetical protein IKF84_01340 [Candidatus Saccharibacteria bacterium]|nr:hypothetical protein [Candidatus Saccharibacteria bacterium]
MDREKILESCKKLVLKCGYNRGRETDYFDDFSCDFHIKHTRFDTVSPKKRDSLEVYLGGREIYDHLGVDVPGIEPLETDLDWLDLADELFLYEIHKYACDEPYIVNSSLIEFYRRKASDNRKFLEKYFKIGMALAEQQGSAKIYPNKSSNISLFKIKLDIDDHEFSIGYRNGIGCSGVSIRCDEHLVFSCCCYDEYGDGHNYEGRYIDSEWKNYLTHYSLT